MYVYIKYVPVISSGKMESRTSRSSIWSSRPIVNVFFGGVGRMYMGTLSK